MVKVLLKVVEGYSVDDAVVVMQEAHEEGVAMVLACPQEEAERYCEGLRLNGLSSSIEPGESPRLRPGLFPMVKMAVNRCLI